MVTGNKIAFFIHTQTAVSVAIIGEAYIQPILHHKLLQTLNVGRTCIVVDIQTIRLIVNYIGICTKCIKNLFCNVPARAVRTVQTDLDTFEGVDIQRNQITHISITTGHIVYRAADMLTMCKRQLQPILVKHMELSIDIILHQQQCFFRHLLTVAVDQLDAVVIVRIMTGRNAVKVIPASPRKPSVPKYLPIFNYLLLFYLKRRNFQISEIANHIFSFLI